MLIKECCDVTAGPYIIIVLIYVAISNPDSQANELLVFAHQIIGHHATVIVASAGDDKQHKTL